jgi:hypothetical protein
MEAKPRRSLPEVADVVRHEYIGRAVDRRLEDEFIVWIRQLWTPSEVDALGFLIAGSTLGAQNQPLPNQESFLMETRQHLQADSTPQSSYVYAETRRALKLDKGGRARGE